MEKKNVCVVGLADIGRSPRLQLHAISFADEGFNVDVIGYQGATPKKELTSHKKIRISYLPPVPEFNKCKSRRFFH
jgi:beta-1,4-mannosyltransferase